MVFSLAGDDISLISFARRLLAARSGLMVMPRGASPSLSLRSDPFVLTSYDSSQHPSLLLGQAWPMRTLPRMRSRRWTRRSSLPVKSNLMHSKGLGE